MRKGRGIQFKIEWGGAEAHSVTAKVFRRAVASGWIEPTCANRAKLAHGVIARWRDGALWLLNKAKQAAVWIYTSWLAVERVSPIIEGPYFRRTLEREHCGPRIVPRRDPRPWWARCDWEASGLRRAA